jgi:hypothetical protein
MLRASNHHVEHLGDVMPRYVCVKQVRHRIDKDRSRASPVKRKVEHSRPECQRETVWEGCGKSQRHPLRVAAITTGRDFLTTSCRVPRRLGPLDCGMFGHGVREYGKKRSPYSGHECN